MDKQSNSQKDAQSLEHPSKQPVQENADFLERIIDTIAEFIYIYDLTQQRNIYISPKFSHALGYSTENGGEIDKDIFATILHPEDMPFITEQHQRWNQNKNIVLEMDYRLKTTKGEWRWFRAREKVYAQEADGTIRLIIGAAQDITEHKQIKDALEKHIVALTRPLNSTDTVAFEDLFNLDDIQRLQDEFADATGVASIITRPDGTPITRPSNFCSLCEDIIRKTPKGRLNCYRSDAMLGRLSRQGPAIQPCMSGGLWDAGAGISVGGQHIANWLIGQVRDETQTEEKMRVYSQEIGADEQDLLSAFFEVPSMSQEKFKRIAQMLYTLANQLSTTAYQNVQQARIINERKRAEAEVRRLNAELEERVVIRTSQLEAALKELEAFSYSVSHDLRAPLRAINGYSHLIEEEYAKALPEDAIRLLNVVQNSAQQMGVLIDSLLRFSRLGRQELNMQKIQSIDLVHQALQTLERERHGRKVELTIHELHPCYGDPVLLLEVWVNLISNAFKYTRQQEVAQIEIGNQTGENSEPCYYIKDNGAGFDMRYVDKLFGVFQRLHRAEDFEGTGVGLALVQRIIHRHGGRIWAEAKPAQGATFFFSLPQAK